MRREGPQQEAGLRQRSENELTVVERSGYSFGCE